MIKLLIVALLVTCVVCLTEARKPINPTELVQVGNAITELGRNAHAQNNNKRNAQEVCYVLKCAGLNGDCTPTIQPNQPMVIVLCTSGFCDDETYTCTAPYANGAFCEDDDNCLSDHCATNQTTGNLTCMSYVLPKDNGETCTTDSDCLYSNCTNNVCVGVGLGGTCYSNSQCNGNVFCQKDAPSDVTGVCIAPLAAGAACKPWTDGCPAGNFCGLNNNQWTCGSMFTPVIGSACNADIQCPDLAYCNVNSTLGYGFCTAAPAPSSGKACDGVCDDPAETCMCNPIIGETTCQKLNSITANPAGSRAALKSAFDCFTSKCASVDDEECFKSYCTKEYCSYIDFMVTQTQDTLYAHLPKCAVDAFDFKGTVEKMVGDSCASLPTAAPTAAPAATVSAVTITVSGTCNDANANTVLNAIKAQFTTKGDIACTTVTTATKKRATGAQYTAQLNAPITPSAAKAALAITSANVQAQGVTVLGTAQSEQAITTNSASGLVAGFAAVLAVAVAVL